MASTEPVTALLEQRWGLSSSVALRPESFGALAYHFGNRRLTFLKRPELVDVLRRLDTAATVGDALAAAGIPPSQWGAFAQALAELAAAQVICPRTTEHAPAAPER